MININSGKGTRSRFMQLIVMSQNFDQITVNIKKPFAGLNENRNVARYSFLLKGYFNKISKAREKLSKTAEYDEEKK